MINLTKKNQIKSVVAILACGFLVCSIVKNAQAASLSLENEENQVEEISFWDKTKDIFVLRTEQYKDSFLSISEDIGNNLGKAKKFFSDKMGLNGIEEIKLEVTITPRIPESSPWYTKISNFFLSKIKDIRDYSYGEKVKDIRNISKDIFSLRVKQYKDSFTSMPEDIRNDLSKAKKIFLDKVSATTKVEKN